jgi:hypothetical protein
MFGISLALTGLILFIFSMAGVGVAPLEFGGRDKDWLTYTFQSILMIGVIAGVIFMISGLIISSWSI